MNYKIKKGDKLLCIKDYVMEEGDIDFTAGYTYIVFQVDNTIKEIQFIDDDGDFHDLSFEDVMNYFKPLSATILSSDNTLLTNTKDNINPYHYKQGKVECIEALESATVNKSGIEAVCTANIIKYLWRYESKNGLEDVKKSKWYLEKLISYLENEKQI